MWFVWSESDAVVGQSVRIAQPELASRHSLHSIAYRLPNVAVHVAMFEVLETLEGGDYHVAVDFPLLPREDYALVAIVADDVVLLVEQGSCLGSGCNGRQRSRNVRSPAFGRTAH